MSRAALFSAGAVGLVLGAADCARPLYGGSPPIDDEDSSPSDAGSGPVSDGTNGDDGAADAPPMAMPHYGGFVPLDGGGGTGDRDDSD